MGKLGNKIRRAVRHSIYNFAPRSPYFDRLVHQLRFMQDTGGTPSTEMSFKDKIFRKLTNGSLDDVLIRAMTERDVTKTVIDGLLKRDACIGTLAVLRSHEEIDAFNFPEGAWVRTTHSYVIPELIGPTPPPVDIFHNWLAHDYYHEMREANYKGLRPGILVEPFMRGGASPYLLVALCFDGDVSLFHTLEIDWASMNHASRRFFDLEWRALDFSVWDPISPILRPQPSALHAIISDCRRIAATSEIIACELLIYPDGEYQFFGISHCPDGGIPKIIPPDAADEYNSRFFRLG